MVVEAPLWEIGSEFHWEGLVGDSFIPWPTPHIFHALGRDAIRGILEASSFSRDSGVLYLPSFFCFDVIASCEEWGAKVRYYEDHPLLAEPDLATLQMLEGDAILAVNYFGLRDGRFWANWKSKNTKALLIEDHTHDPLSTWAINSTADYCFSSLRKVLPVPDGAVSWSPVGTLLPESSAGKDWRGSSLKLAAMVLKKEYLGGQPIAKADFRKLQIEGEELYSHVRDGSISPWSYSILQAGYPAEWRKVRERNVSCFLDLLPENDHLQPLFTSWPVGHCPFNGLVIFKSQEERDNCRKKLATKNVFSPVHWALPNTGSPDSIDISSRILTIPLDQRYGVEDIEKIISIFVND